VRWVAAFDFPDVERDYEFVALRHTDEYPSTKDASYRAAGLTLRLANTKTIFEETHVERSTALHSHLRERAHISWDPLPVTASTSIACRGSPKKSHVTWG